MRKGALISGADRDFQFPFPAAAQDVKTDRRLFRAKDHGHGKARNEYERGTGGGSNMIDMSSQQRADPGLQRKAPKHESAPQTPRRCVASRGDRTPEETHAIFPQAR